MDFELRDINNRSSEIVFGMRATSRSIKPVHLANHLFARVQGKKRLFDDEALEVLASPSKEPTDELDPAVRSIFDEGGSTSDKQVDRVRRRIRSVLGNDDTLYKGNDMIAPTCTSDYSITKPKLSPYGSGEILDSVGRFLYELAERADSDISDALHTQLEDHHDGVSLLIRPLIENFDSRVESVDDVRWNGPEIDSEPFAEDKMANDLVDGYETLGTHLNQSHKGKLNYPRDLERVVRFGCFSFYVFLVNRHQEINDDIERSAPVPILLNYLERETAVEEASIASVNNAHAEVERATRIGISDYLERSGVQNKDKEWIIEQLEAQIDDPDQVFLDVHRQSGGDKFERDLNTAITLLDSSTAGSDYEQFVGTLNDALHLSQFKAFPPRNTAQTFGWRAGLLRPGQGTTERWFEFNSEILEVITMSIVGADRTEMSLREFCGELRQRYGIIVGATSNDRSHLQEYGIEVGADADRSDVLSGENATAFTDRLVELGLAERYADGVTIVSPNQD